MSGQGTTTAIWLIRRYQRHLSPRLSARGVQCLHYPTCSEYGCMAFEKYGILKATWKTISRIRDCNPLSGRPYIDYP